MYTRARDATACSAALSPCDHVTSTPQRTQVTVSPMGIASDHHSTDAEVRHSASHGYTNGNVPRPDMDTWNVKGKSMPLRPGRLAGSPARTGVPPFRAMQGLVRAAEAFGRGDTDVCLPRTSAYTQSVRDEVHWHLLHWKADICCYSLQRGPLGQERIR